ncbi:hypothetical protein ACWF94_18705 [Streptomyces sp. NPDC055078]
MTSGGFGAVPAVERLAREVRQLMDTTADEHELTAHVAHRLRSLLASRPALPRAVTRPGPTRYVMYPLHIAADGSFSIAAAVWDVGQRTPVHGHETWGVVGIYAGVEAEVRYEKPAVPGRPLVPAGAHEWTEGEVTVCCTTDDDVHEVRCGGDTPCVGIHVYGADIGQLPRRAYDPDTGEVDWFVSRWTETGGASPR